eukprot:3818450-Prymnesium_polylepis.1
MHPRGILRRGAGVGAARRTGVLSGGRRAAGRARAPCSLGGAASRTQVQTAVNNNKDCHAPALVIFPGRRFVVRLIFGQMWRFRTKWAEAWPGGEPMGLVSVISIVHGIA